VGIRHKLSAGRSDLESQLVALRHGPIHPLFHREGAFGCSLFCMTASCTLLKIAQRLRLLRAPSTSGRHQDRGRETRAPEAKRRKLSCTWAPHVCAEFNAKGNCSFGARCKFCHACGNCNGDHPAKSCPSSKQQRRTSHSDSLPLPYRCIDHSVLGHRRQ
jgi:hypothetical protein